MWIAWIVTGALAQEPDLGWLVGHWQGSQGDTVYEEHWEGPLGGVMLGSFRLARADEVVFYELITIGPHEGAPAMRIKHFGADLVGWEPRKKAMDFALVEHAPDRAVFHLAEQGEWLVYERVGDALTIRLLEGEQPTETVLAFEFTRR
jgi:hypothetical protein